MFFHLPDTDEPLTEDVAAALDYEDVTKQQMSADVKASQSASIIDDSSSQYETLTPATNDATVADVYQQLGNN